MSQRIYEVMVNHLNVHVEQESKYKMPWDKETDGERPADYFDCIKTKLSFVDPVYGKIHALIEGKGRCEKIRVFNADWVPLDLTNYADILSMTRTFTPSIMHDVIHTLSTKLGNNQWVTPYLEVFDNKHDQVKSSESIQRILSPYIKAMTTHQPVEIIIPLVTFNKVGEHAHHWYLCLVESNAQGYTVTIIDSINKAKKQPLQEIKARYDEQIIGAINQLIESHGGQAVPMDEVQYAEILQYGNMGCGITASINMESLLEPNRRINAYHHDDIRPVNALEGYVIYAENKTIPLSSEQCKRIFLDGDSQLDVTGYSEENGFIAREQDLIVVHDKSKRLDSVTEGVRRIQLALTLAHRDELILQEHSSVSHVSVLSELKANPWFKSLRARADTASLMIDRFKDNMREVRKVDDESGEHPVKKI